MKRNFETVYRKLSGPVIKFIAKRTGADSEIVDEIFSQTMIAAWKGWQTFENKSSYFTWICRIALNKAADYYRKEVNRKSKFIAPLIEELIEPGQLSLEESLALEDLKLAVNRALELLPVTTRRILHLRYWQDATIREIAQMLSVSEKAAEGKLYRARKAFSRAVATSRSDQV